MEENKITLEDIFKHLGYTKVEDTWIKKYQVQEPLQIMIINGRRSASKPKIHTVELKITDMGYILSDGPEVDGNIWTGPKYKHLSFFRSVDNVCNGEFEIAAEISDLNFFSKHIESFTN